MEKEANKNVALLYKKRCCKMKGPDVGLFDGNLLPQNGELPLVDNHGNLMQHFAKVSTVDGTEVSQSE